MTKIETMTALVNEARVAVADAAEDLRALPMGDPDTAARWRKFVDSLEDYRIAANALDEECVSQVKQMAAASLGAYGSAA